MSQELPGTTLVVGAVSSIGVSIVEELKKHSYDLLFTWHEHSSGQKIDGKYLQVDLTELTDILQLLESVRSINPPWQNLVYVAGDYWADQGKPFEEEDWSRATQIFQVNATAFTVLVRNLNELLTRQNLKGRVVAISSTSASHGSTNAPIYAASKAALNRLILDAAVRYGKNLSVAAVAPGPVNTPMLATTPKGRDDYEAETPTGVLSTPEEIASGVMFLLPNPQISGQILNVDGARIVR